MTRDYERMSNEDLARELIRHNAPIPGNVSAIRCVRSLDGAANLLPDLCWRIESEHYSIVIAIYDYERNFKAKNWRENLARYIAITWLEWEDRHTP